jgi:peptidyl-prolyl cis-trans isomerase D
MMNGIRRAGQSWLGRVVVAILFGFLILSFAIWGIGDMLRNAGHVNVAKVGSKEITVQAYRDAYQAELQTLSRRAKRNITSDEARAAGLDRQVLNRMITELALDQRASALGLDISEKALAQAIFTDPAFKNAAGQFDRNLFNEALRNNGFTEQGFLRTQHNVYLRQQLAESVAGVMPAPAALRDAAWRFRSETRNADYVVLGPSAAGEIADADDATLQKFFDERKAEFRAPEYRKAVLLRLSPADVAKPDQVSDAEAQAFYDANKQRFGQPERRSVQQIVFPSKEDAEAASERIKGGTAFDAIAQERKLDAKDFDLGVVTKAGIIDPKVADAAFAMPQPGVSDPVEGRFGTVLVRVEKIEPEHVQSFDEVKDAIRAEIATKKAKDAMQDVHDAIEDQRASAKPLVDIARERNLPLVTIDAVDRAGLDKSGKPVDVPDRASVLKAILASDIGVDNEPVAAKDGGWVWFDVTGIEPPRDRSLAEVRDEVLKQWKDDQIAGRVADRAAQLVKDIQGGKTLEAVATELGTEVRKAQGVRRQGADGGLPATAVSQVFGTQVGGVASAIGATPQDRVILHVTSAEVPPLATSTQEATQLDEQIKLALGDDVLSAYVAKVQNELGVSINETVLRQAVGGGV